MKEKYLKYKFKISKRHKRNNKIKSSIKKYLLILLLSIFFSTFIIFFIFNKFIRRYKSNTKVGLCIICKRENLYIKEFVNHYKNLGYNHIFIYDNNNIDEENFDTVLKKEIKEGFVTIIDYRGRNYNRQIFDAYIDCYEKNNKDYNWLSFFDIDEFLELKPKGIKIQEFLDNERYKNCQNVKFNWLIYTDSDKLHYENKPIQKRFTKYLDNHVFFNKHVKSTVRGNLSKNYWIGAPNPHTSNNEFSSCSSSGKEIDRNSPFNYPPDYKYAILKHYRTKTIEEYINKMKKGKPDTKINYNMMVEFFFGSNKITDEKIDIFNKEFNIKFNKSMLYKVPK